MSAIDLVVYKGTTLLAGADLGATGAGGALVVGLTVSGKRAIDTVSFIRALSVRNFDRFTMQKKVSLMIATQEASLTASLTGVLTDDDNNLSVADLRLLFTESGVTTQFRSKRGGWTQSQVGQWGGYSRVTQYDIVCGPFTVITGDSDPVWWDSAIDGGDAGSEYTGLIHGGGYADTHLHSELNIFGGTAADHVA